MRKILNIAIILLQLGLTFLVLFCIYMLFAMFDYEGGIANFIGLTFFQPLLAILFSGLTIAVCLLIGLPLRIYSKLNIWWRNKFYIPIILIFIGFVFCVNSLMPIFLQEVTYRMEGVDMSNLGPNPFLSISGWFMVAFGTLHLYLPIEIQKRFEDIIEQVHK